MARGQMAIGGELHADEEAMLLVGDAAVRQQILAVVAPLVLR